MEITYNNDGYPIGLSHPRYLFKYVSDNENTKSSLSESYLWFSSSDSFNDPFEFRNALSKSTNKKSIRKLIREAYPDANRRQLSALAARFQKDVDLQRKIITAIHVDEVSKTFVCCLTADASNVLMWSHYANSHRGLCLVFDFNELFKPSGFSATKIEYVDHPRVIDFAELYSRPPVPKTDHEIKQILFGTKLKEWSYEREFRMLSDRPGRNLVPTSAIAGVVFGARVAKGFKDSVVTILESLYPHAKAVDAKLNGSKGTVEVPDFTNEMLEKTILGYSGDPAKAHTAYYVGDG